MLVVQKILGYRIVGIFIFLIYTATSAIAQSTQFSSDEGDFYKVANANWLNNSKSAATIVWDDSNPAHYTVSEIMEKYGFRGTFVVNPGKGDWNVLTDLYKQMSVKGHEIGNHSWHHTYLVQVDTDSLVAEIVRPIEFITNLTGKRPETFVQPYNQTNALVDSVILANHLFSRISSSYSMNNRIRKSIYSYTEFSEIKSKFEASVKEKKWLIITGHGLDSVGWEPITSAFLDSICILISNSTETVWVAPLGEIAAYDYIRREIEPELQATESGILLTIKNLDLAKYKNIERLPFSYILKTEQNIEINADANNLVDVSIRKEKSGVYIITTDLKQTQTIYLSISNIFVETSANIEKAGKVNGSANFNYGEKATVFAEPNHGYEFINWTENNEVVSTNASYSFNVQMNRNLVANFKPLTFEIEVLSNNLVYGKVDGNGKYSFDSNILVKAIANSGYEFANWTENNEVISTEKELLIKVEKNRKLIANFKPIVFLISVSANESLLGTVAGSGSFDYGTEISVTATPSAKSIFVHWAENGEFVSNQPQYSFVVEADRNLLAVFTPATGIADLNNDIKIYPTFANDYLIIGSNLPISQIRFTDSLGRILKVIKDNTYEIGIAELSHGIYYLQLAINQKLCVFKFVKQ